MAAALAAAPFRAFTSLRSGCSSDLSLEIAAQHPVKLVNWSQNAAGMVNVERQDQTLFLKVFETTPYLFKRRERLHPSVEVRKDDCLYHSL